MCKLHNDEMQHTKNLNPGRFELDTTLSLFRGRGALLKVVGGGEGGRFWYGSR